MGNCISYDFQLLHLVVDKPEGKWYYVIPPLKAVKKFLKNNLKISKKVVDNSKHA